MSTSARYSVRQTQPRLIWLHLTLLTIISLVSAANNVTGSKTCWWPDGTPNAFFPCNPEADDGICCGAGFLCLSNGLCQSPPGIGLFKYPFLRATCTDRTYKSPACAHFCLSREDNLSFGQGVQLCDFATQTYCCGRQTDCCTNSTLLFQLNAPEIVTTVPLPMATSAGNPNAAEPDMSQSTKETVLGIVIGFAISALAFITVGVWWILRRRQRRKSKLAESVESAEPKELDATETSQTSATTISSIESTTLGGQSNPIELDTLPSRVELEDTMPLSLSPVTPMTPGGEQRPPKVYELEAPFKLDLKPGDG